MKFLKPLFIFALFVLVQPQRPSAETNFITVASTTSTENSGLFKWILPKFSAATGIQVRVVAVGTGQAIRIAQNGDADVLFVHHKPSEIKFVKDGYGVKRYDVMYNDFVIVGPKTDPAGIKEAKNASEALTAIASTKSIFVSRGDNSGTHKKEQFLWNEAGIDPVKSSGSWYRESGSGMGATLNTTAAMGGYALSDRGTWLSFKNRQSLTLLNVGDKNMLNPYGVILVNPKKFPHVKAKLGQQFIDWLVSVKGQTAIAAFRINDKVLFKPNANGG